MFEKPQKAQVVRIKIEAFSLDSTSLCGAADLIPVSCFRVQP